MPEFKIISINTNQDELVKLGKEGWMWVSKLEQVSIVDGDYFWDVEGILLVRDV